MRPRLGAHSTIPESRTAIRRTTLSAYWLVVRDVAEKEAVRCILLKWKEVWEELIIDTPTFVYFRFGWSCVEMLQRSPGTEPRPLTSSLKFKNGAVCTVSYSPGQNTDGKGKGLLQWQSGRYRGEFLGLQRHGKGEQHWSDGSHYKGEFKKNLRDGDGQFFWKSGHVSVTI